jgi:DNA-binding CsgD family transcriptional regulator
MWPSTVRTDTTNSSAISRLDRPLAIIAAISRSRRLSGEGRVAERIAGVIARGLSNREIADELVVSVRTVEGHIYRACMKVNVSDRDDLAAVFSAAAQS